MRLKNFWSSILTIFQNRKNTFQIRITPAMRHMRHVLHDTDGLPTFCFASHLNNTPFAIRLTFLPNENLKGNCVNSGCASENPIKLWPYFFSRQLSFPKQLCKNSSQSYFCHIGIDMYVSCKRYSNNIAKIFNLSWWKNSIRLNSLISFHTERYNCTSIHVFYFILNIFIHNENRQSSANGTLPVCVILSSISSLSPSPV